MEPGAAIEALGLKFSYPRGAAVLRGVELRVAPGEIVGVIGPNGSGKTTLVNVLASTLRPEAGEVRVFGQRTVEMSSRERAREVAVVPQEPRVAFPFTVMEIALMGRAPFLGRWQLEAAGDLAAAREALEMTEVYELRDRKFNELSGGEKQRVMTAKALCQGPRVLLLDEPTAFLDLRHQVEIYELMRRLAADKGLAVLAVSHDVNLAAMFCDRVAVLFEGAVEAVGRPAEVLKPELLQRVYGVAVGLARHPARGEAPLIFPLSNQLTERIEKGP